jgi:type II secretory pathway pseudopilin PulG
VNEQTDSELLRDYAERHSEPAFAELVRRYVDLVHSAAQRMICDAHLAEDVTQTTFVALARNAADLTNRPVLSGWLHRTAQNIAEQTFANMAQGAVTKFSRATGSPFPTDLSQLQPYFDPPVDAGILQRWEILPPGSTIPGIGNQGPFISQKAPVDDVLDRRFAIMSGGGFASTDFLNSEIQNVMMPVYQAYAAANHGVYSGNPSEYLSFATTPEQQGAVQKLLQQGAARK